MERTCHHDTCEFPHPFVHQVKLSTAQRIRVFVVASVLFPVRMALASVCFLLLWGLARLRLAGLSREERRSRPLAAGGGGGNGGGGWRERVFPPLVWLLSRAVFFCLGFLWVRVKGRRADLREAPVLAVAPHSGFLDMLVLCPARLATVVSRSENTAIPAIGALLEYNQAVIVSRKDPESRKRAVTQIKERLTSNGYWPQMLMFPEGTTTNGRSLIKFKPGAFLAGVPVQPVLLHYPNKLDSVRWTYKGTTWLETLWYTSAQLYTNITVEFLPVYTPSQEEKDDPSLYADNVQKLMAKALGIPATDYVMEGRIPVCKLGGLSLPLDPPARKALGLLHKAGLGASEVEAVLYRLADWCRSAAQGWKASTQELSSLLGLADGQTAISLCALYSKDDSVDLRQVYSSVAPISGCVSFSSTLHTAFALFDKEGRGSLDAVELSGLMGALLGVPQYETSQLHTEASSNGQLTEQDLLRVLTTHPTYQRVVNEYLQPEEAGSQMSYMALANGKTVNNNIAMQNGNGVPSANKKAD